MRKRLTQIVSSILKLILGLLLIPLFHFPKLLILLLELSYASVFNNTSNLTADPAQHLKRAKKLLRKKQNSIMLYAALELRFALERIVHFQLLLANGSNKMLKEYDPVKKRNNISRIDPESDFSYKIFYRNPETNKKFLWGVYRPISKDDVNFIKGRLGDLLHPKDGIPLGISNDIWYVQTREFLLEALKILSEHIKNNEQYFAMKGVKNIEFEKIEF